MVVGRAKLALGPIFAHFSGMRHISIAPIFLLFCIAFHVAAQPQTGATARIEILHADRWDYDQLIVKGAQRLIGGVRFKHADAIMRCDSAYLFEDQTMKAYANVSIVQGDTLTITGDRLDYVGKDRMATITGNVHLSDPSMDMTTDALTYGLKDRVAHYSTGARIVSRKEQNTLTSRTGSYLAVAHKFLFSGDVKLEHPERTIEADTLHYTTSSGVAEFFGPTRITQGGTKMFCERGSYDTRAERGRFTRAGRVVSKGQELRGDSLHYDKKSGDGLAWGHVSVIDTAQKMTVNGDIGTHSEHDAHSMITGHAELIMRMGKDSLFLHGDTLFATQDSAASKRITARRHVRFFKNDMQGVCDTMIYTERDSLIQLHGAPFLWSGKDQINGRVITITLRDGKAHLLHVLHDALLANSVDSTATDDASARYDQVTGINMTGYFANNEIHRIIAEGNTRTVYFVKEKKDSTERITGLNRADCSRIEVLLDSGKVRSITFITKPDAVTYPIAKAPADQLRMKGFVWNEAMRPKERKGIFE